MTDLENLQRQEHRYETAEEERFTQLAFEITNLFKQLSVDAQYDLLERLAVEFNLDLED